MQRLVQIVAKVGGGWLADGGGEGSGSTRWLFLSWQTDKNQLLFETGVRCGRTDEPTGAQG